MTERETKFVDVILPLALPRLLTYRVPQPLNDIVFPGQRVVVQLGKNKLNTAIIRYVHTQPPIQYQAKYIESLLDDRPLVLEQQMKLWEWIADYYCCTLGEVMNAALPGGLKLSSETKFTLIEREDLSTIHFSEKEKKVSEILLINGAMTLADIAAAMDMKNIQPLMKGLIEKGWVISTEEWKEKFTPKKTDFVRLSAWASNEKTLKEIFDDLEKKRSRKQSEALLMLLQLSKWDEGRSVEVERLQLQKKAGVDAAIISALAEKKIIEVYAIETGRLLRNITASEKLPVLSDAQQTAQDEIESHWQSKSVVLLKGVTSSGKTEIYASLIQQAITQGKQVLFLLPEIALTTQIINRLRKYFGQHLTVYHSGYSENERTEVWNKVLRNERGDGGIVLGARSALFLPWSNLGLVIVDEEHEHSFKQHDPAPRYHARDTAIILAGYFNAHVLLGSATPAIESYYNARQQRYGLVQLKDRFGGIEMPEIVINDLRKDIKGKTMQRHFSSLLVAEMKKALELERQIILFQNRRGYSPLWQCQQCGWIPQCTRCDVSLTYHKSAHQLKCHYCGYSTQPPSTCAACGSTTLRMLGFGTEKIEEDLRELFPEVKVQRMDLDTTRNKTGYQKIIHGFEQGDIQILVGTQMVTKGLDFDKVSLVGILNADKMMNYPDFRSIERSFQLMMQVAGRAGRRDERGKVIIQTYAPQHWLLDWVVKGDYDSFFAHEIRERQQYAYPPWVRLIKITLKHKEEATVENAAVEMAKALHTLLGSKVLGPEKPHVHKINNLFLQQLLIKLDRSNLSTTKAALRQLSKEVLDRQGFKSVRMVFDVDPI